MENKDMAFGLIVALVFFGVAVKYLDDKKPASSINATKSIIINAGRDLNMSDGAVGRIRAENEKEGSD